MFEIKSDNVMNLEGDLKKAHIGMGAKTNLGNLYIDYKDAKVSLVEVVSKCRADGVTVVRLEDGTYAGVKDRILSTVNFKSGLDCYVYYYTEYLG